MQARRAPGRLREGGARGTVEGGRGGGVLGRRGTRARAARALRVVVAAGCAWEGARGPGKGRQGEAGRGEARGRRTGRARGPSGASRGSGAVWRPRGGEASFGARVLTSWGLGLGAGQVRKAPARARGARGVPERGWAAPAGAQRDVGRACCARTTARPRGSQAADGGGRALAVTAPSRVQRRARGGEAGPLACHGCVRAVRAWRRAAAPLAELFAPRRALLGRASGSTELLLGRSSRPARAGKGAGLCGPRAHTSAGRGAGGSQ